MTQSIDRRKFLAGSAAAAACASSPVTASPSRSVGEEYYELRRYRIETAENRDAVSGYLESALLPALRRAGLDRIGVFTVTADPPDFSLHVLIPFATIQQFAGLQATLGADDAYQEAARDHFKATDAKPAYQRIESRFLVAFRGMPKLELPPKTASGQRMFEIRTYESHTEDAARRKVEMFDEGEIQLMRDVELGPVFFGSTLIGPDVPNLTYMLSATTKKAHDEHWQAFRTHATWTKMKAIPRYLGTVSKITQTFLAPTKYSQI